VRFDLNHRLRRWCYPSQ